MVAGVLSTVPSFAIVYVENMVTNRADVLVCETVYRFAGVSSSGGGLSDTSVSASASVCPGDTSD